MTSRTKGGAFFPFPQNYNFGIAGRRVTAASLKYPESRDFPAFTEVSRAHFAQHSRLPPRIGRRAAADHLSAL
jgi:hypothetical protein